MVAGWHRALTSLCIDPLVAEVCITLSKMAHHRRSRSHSWESKRGGCAPLPPTGDPWKLHTAWLLTSHCPGLFAGRAWGRRRWEMPPSFWRMRRWEMPPSFWRMRRWEMSPSVWGKRRWEMPPLFWVVMCLAIIWAFVTTGEKGERENW